MRLRNVFFLLSIASVASISDARADWQYSKWGMSPDQVARASRGTATVMPFDSRKVRRGLACVVQGSYQSGMQLFDMEGCFENQTLQMVVLRLRVNSKIEVQEILSSLSARYGRPVIQGDINYFWTDAKTGNQITLSDISDFARSIEIYYKPIKSGSGL